MANPSQPGSKSKGRYLIFALAAALLLSVLAMLTIGYFGGEDDNDLNTNEQAQAYIATL